MTTRQDLRASGAGPPQGGVLVGPALAAVLVTVVADGRTGLVDLARRALRWRVGTAWWLVVVATFALSGLGALVAPRGFAVERLLRDHDVRWTALVVGVGWAGWHLPFTPPSTSPPRRGPPASSSAP